MKLKNLHGLNCNADDPVTVKFQDTEYNGSQTITDTVHCNRQIHMQVDTLDSVCLRYGSLPAISGTGLLDIRGDYFQIWVVIDT